MQACQSLRVESSIRPPSLPPHKSVSLEHTLAALKGFVFLRCLHGCDRVTATLCFPLSSGTEERNSQLRLLAWIRRHSWSFQTLKRSPQMTPKLQPATHSSPQPGWKCLYTPYESSLVALFLVYRLNISHFNSAKFDNGSRPLPIIPHCVHKDQHVI